MSDPARSTTPVDPLHIEVTAQDMIGDPAAAEQQLRDAAAAQWRAERHYTELLTRAEQLRATTAAAIDTASEAFEAAGGTEWTRIRNEGHQAAAGEPRRYRLGEPYRPSNLRPGVIVEQAAYRSGNRIVTGSPCCGAVAHLERDDVAHMLDRKARGLPAMEVDRRRCGDCGGWYALRVVDSTHGTPITNPAVLHTRSFTVDWTVQ